METLEKYFGQFRKNIVGINSTYQSPYGMNDQRKLRPKSIKETFQKNQDGSASPFTPTMTDSELLYIMDAIEQIVNHAKEWGKDYTYSPRTNEFYHTHLPDQREKILNDWFKL